MLIGLVQQIALQAVPGVSEVASYTGGAMDPPESELHNPQVEPICRKYLELRYRLMPYLYSAVRECAETGMPILRAMWLHYPDDAAAAAQRGVHLELTTRRGHCLTNGHVAAVARTSGASLVLNTDAHSPSDLVDAAFARLTALGAGLSTGEYEVLQQNMARLAGLGEGVDPADALATLTASTASVVAQDLARGARPLELLVAGGGTRNGFLMEQLQRRCRGMAVRRLASCGIADEHREALAFALLAWWRWRGHPGSLPSVTGARRAAVLGVIASPPPSG